MYSTDFSDSSFPRGLNYIGNSCYQDSVLVALFSEKKKVIWDKILRVDLDNLEMKWINCDIELRNSIQEELNNIASFLIGEKDCEEKNCENIRKLIKKVPIRGEKFWDRRMHDAGEFLSFLFSLFQVNTSVTKTTTYGSRNGLIWEKTSQSVDRNASPIVPVFPELLEDGKTKSIDSFLIQKDVAVLSEDNLYYHKRIPYNHRKKIWKCVKSSFIVFQIHRLTGLSRVAERIDTEVLPVPKIGKLELFAIIVHQRSHYTSYIKQDDCWYYYDDNPFGSEYIMERVGNYGDMLISDPNPMRNGVLYFYA